MTIQALLKQRQTIPITRCSQKVLRKDGTGGISCGPGSQTLIAFFLRENINWEEEYSR